MPSIQHQLSQYRMMKKISDKTKPSDLSVIPHEINTLRIPPVQEFFNNWMKKQERRVQSSQKLNTTC